MSSASTASMSIRELEQSRADLTKIPSLEPNRLVGFINHFAVRLVAQLNNLNDAAEHKLYHLHSRILTCKTNLLILEKKLASVDGLTAVPTSFDQPRPVVAETDSSCVPPDVPEREDDEHDGQESSRTNSNESTDEIHVVDVAPGGGKDDAELQRFYKMLKVGVPLPAVRMKMLSEGVDPDLLNA